MMIKRLSLIVWFIGSLFTSLHGMGQVICFDVAQGNSVVVGSTDPHETALPCLIDAGCKAYTYRGKNFNTEQVVRIVEALKRFATISNQEFYNIIISHPDEDHYNLLPAIVAGCRGEGLEPQNIILGGVRALYNEEFQLFLDGLTAQADESDRESSNSDTSSKSKCGRSEIADDWFFSDDSVCQSDARDDSERASQSSVVYDFSRESFEEDSENVASEDEESTEEASESSKSSSEEEVVVPLITYLTEDGDTTQVNEVDSGVRLKYSILPAKQATTESAKNDGSLVVLIGYEDLLFLVAGDATKITTDHILTYCPDLKVHGLHAGHHGAEQHGCNSEEWLTTLEPEAIVFSSGINKGHRHPQGAVLQRSQRLLPAVEGPYRALYSGTTKKGDYSDTYFNGIGLNGYGLSVSQKHLYGTLGQGTITFSIAPEDTELKAPECSRGDSYPDIKSCVLESLIKSPSVILPLSDLVTLNLSCLGIKDSVPADKDRLYRLLTVLKKEGSHLNYVFLKDNAINKPASVAHLEELLDACKYIKDFDMRRNGLSLKFKNLLKKKATRSRTIKL